MTVYWDWTPRDIAIVALAAGTMLCSYAWLRHEVRQQRRMRKRRRS